MNEHAVIQSWSISHTKYTGIQTRAHQEHAAIKINCKTVHIWTDRCQVYRECFEGEINLAEYREIAPSYARYQVELPHVGGDYTNLQKVQCMHAVNLAKQIRGHIYTTGA